MKRKKNDYSKDTYIDDTRRRQGFVGGEPREQTIPIRYLTSFQKGLLLYFFFCLYINDVLSRKNSISKQKDKPGRHPYSVPTRSLINYQLVSNLTLGESTFPSTYGQSPSSLISMVATDLTVPQKLEIQSSRITKPTVEPKKGDIVLSKTKMQKIINDVVTNIKEYDLNGLKKAFKFIDVNSSFLRDGNEYTFLEYAVKKENLAATTYFLEKGAHIYNERQKESYDAITIAINNKNNLILRTLLEFDKEKTQQIINLPTNFLGGEFTYIARAVLGSNLDAISVLLDAGADINHKLTLHFLAELLRMEMSQAITKSDFFKDLLKHEIDCKILIKNFKNIKASKQEVLTLLFDIFKTKYLLSGSKNDEINYQLNELVFTFMPDYELVWTSYNGSRDRYLTRLLKYLQVSRSQQLSVAIDVNQLAEEYAKISSSIPYDINSVFHRDEIQSFTLLTYAVYKNQLADVSFLLSHGADLVKENQDALFMSISNQRIDILRVIVDQKKQATEELVNKYILDINENTLDKSSNSNGLLLAVKNKDTKALSILVNQVKNPVIKRNSYLFWINSIQTAVITRNNELLETILAFDKAIMKKVINTPLVLSDEDTTLIAEAILANNVEAITILLKSGAEINNKATLNALSGLFSAELEDESLPVLAKALLIESAIENCQYPISKFLIEQGHTYQASYSALLKFDADQLSLPKKKILSTAKILLMHLKANGKLDNFDSTLTWQKISHAFSLVFESRRDWTEYDFEVWDEVLNSFYKLIGVFVVSAAGIGLRLKMNNIFSLKESNNATTPNQETVEHKTRKVKKEIPVKSQIRQVFHTPDLNPIVERARLAADLKEKIKHMKNSSEEYKLALAAFTMEVTETNIDELFPLSFEKNKSVHRIFKVCKLSRSYCEETRKQLDEKIDLLAKQADLLLTKINSAIATSMQIDPVIEDQFLSLEATRKSLQTELNALVIKQDEYSNKYADLNNAIKRANKVNKNSTPIKALKPRLMLPTEEKPSADAAPITPIGDDQAPALISPKTTVTAFFKPSPSSRLKIADDLNPRECDELLHQILSIQDDAQYQLIFIYLQKALSTKDPLARGASATPICKATRFWIISLLAACHEAKLLRNEQLRHYFSHDNLRKEIRDVDQDRIYLTILCELEKLVKRFDFSIDSPKIIVQQQMSRIVSYIDVTIIAVLKAEGLYNESTMQDYRKVIPREECAHLITEMRDMFTRVEIQAYESEIINNYEQLLIEENAPGLQLLNFMSDLITLGEQVRVLRAVCKTQDGGAYFFNTECPRLIKIVQYRNNVCHNDEIISLSQCLGLSADYHPSQFKKWFRGVRNQLQELCHFLEDNYLRPSQFELSK